MFSTKSFLKEGLQDNQWAGLLLMKPLDAMEFDKIQSHGEGKNYLSNNFEMDILDGVELDKALTFPEKYLDGKKPKRNFMSSLAMTTSNNQMLSFQKILY